MERKSQILISASFMIMISLQLGVCIYISYHFNIFVIYLFWSAKFYRVYVFYGM